MVKLFQAGTLVAATLMVGWMAGLFACFAYAVMPGLAAADDRTFVIAMQRINSAILNGWFALGFGGALVFTAVAAGLHFGATGRGALPWIIAALVLYVAVLVITFAVNVPLNNELDAAGTPASSAGFAAAREKFETVWVRWNIVRAVGSTAALGCLTWALVLFGRATS